MIELKLDIWGKTIIIELETLVGNLLDFIPNRSRQDANALLEGCHSNLNKRFDTLISLFGEEIVGCHAMVKQLDVIVEHLEAQKFPILSLVEDFNKLKQFFNMLFDLIYVMHHKLSSTDTRYQQVIDPGNLWCKLYETDLEALPNNFIRHIFINKTELNRHRNPVQAAESLERQTSKFQMFVQLTMPELNQNLFTSLHESISNILKLLYPSIEKAKADQPDELIKLWTGIYNYLDLIAKHNLEVLNAAFTGQGSCLRFEAQNRLARAKAHSLDYEDTSDMSTSCGSNASSQDEDCPPEYSHAVRLPELFIAQTNEATPPHHPDMTIDDSPSMKFSPEGHGLFKHSGSMFFHPESDHPLRRDSVTMTSPERPAPEQKKISELRSSTPSRKPKALFQDNDDLDDSETLYRGSLTNSFFD